MNHFFYYCFKQENTLFYVALTAYVFNSLITWCSRTLMYRCSLNLLYTEQKMGKNKGPKLSKSKTGRNLKEFCESTSLHGYGYIYNNESIALKLFRLFIILNMTGLGILFLVTNTMEFLEHKVYTTTETSSAPISVSITIPVFHEGEK